LRSLSAAEAQRIFWRAKRAIQLEPAWLALGGARLLCDLCALSFATFALKTFAAPAETARKNLPSRPNSTGYLKVST
jgi:hypothetical protein